MIDHPMQPNDPKQPHTPSARRCEEHQRLECTRRRKRGGDCHSPAVRGLDACRMHAGTSGEVARAKGSAISEWSALAGQPTVSATEAVLGMLHMSWLRVHLYAGLLERQFDDERGAGLVGFTRSAAHGIGIFTTGEAIRGLALLEAQERDRCVKFAKVAHDMGIAEHQVKIAEQQGVMLAGAVTRILDALNLSAEQQALVPEVVPGILRAIGEAG